MDQTRKLIISTYSSLQMSGGGIESWLQKILTYRGELLNNYSDICIIGQNPKSDSIADVFQDEHVKFNFYSKNSLISGIVNYINCIRAIAKKYKKEKIDIIFVGSLYPSLPILFLPKKIKTYIWLRSFYEYEINQLKIKKIKPLALFLEKKCLQRAKKIIANGEDTKFLYKNKYKSIEKEIIVIPNAIDVNAVKNNKNTLRCKVVKIAFIGRFYKNKGIEEFINSIKEINKIRVDKRFQFLFVGYGEFEEEIRTLETQFDNVKLVGKVNNSQIFDFLSTIDCTVNLTFSAKEGGGSGVSNSLLESIYSDNLPIAWGNFCFKQILTNENSVLIDEGNALELAKAYLAIFNRRDFYLKKVKNLNLLKEKYSFSNHIEQLLEVLDG